MNTRLSLVLLVATGQLGCVSSPAQPAAPTAPVPPAAAAINSEPVLTVARNGTEVLLSWTIPPGSYKGIEIIRHIQPAPKGRSRIGFVPSNKTTHLDTVADKAVTYWYWLKVARADGTVLSVGPVMSIPTEVWTP